MRLISLLNRYQHFPSFVYERARHCASSQTIEITVRPRRFESVVAKDRGVAPQHLGQGLSVGPKRGAARRFTSSIAFTLSPR
jgi:hypothetical protein